MKMEYRLVAVALPALLMSVNASAAGYVGIGLGSTSYTEAAATTDLTYDIELGDRGYKFSGGWMFNDYFGVEVAHYSFADTAWTIDSLNIDLGLTGNAGFVVAKLPIMEDKVSVLGKVGMLKWEMSGSFSDGVDTYSMKGDDSDIMWGVGVEFMVDKSLSVVGEWESIAWDAPAGVDVTTSYMGASLRYNF